MSLTRVAGTDITDLSSMLHTVHFRTTAYRQCQPGESRFTRYSHVFGSQGLESTLTTHAFFNSRSGIPAHPKRSALFELISILPANEKRKSKHQGKSGKQKANERTRILQYRAPLRRHQRPFRRLIPRLEIVANLLHLHPFDALFRRNVLDEPISQLRTVSAT